MNDILFDVAVVLLATAFMYVVLHFAFYGYRPQPGALFPDGQTDDREREIFDAAQAVSDFRAVTRAGRFDRQQPAVILPIDLHRRQMATSRKGRD